MEAANESAVPLPGMNPSIRPQAKGWVPLTEAITVLIPGLLESAPSHTPARLS